MEPGLYTALTLRLADGRRWLIRAGDAEAACVVMRLGQVMHLPPVTAVPNATHELLVVTGDRAHTGSRIPGHSSVACVVEPPGDENMLVVAMTRVALAIACETLASGGLLLHGALAAYQGTGGSAATQGVILAGPGNVGKTTASSRLRPPWRSLCDDTTLVVRDAEGTCWAHPWPTWSRFFSYDGQPAPGGQWPVEGAVPLHAIFFLSQAAEDRVESRSPAQATAMLMEVVEHVTRPAIRSLSAPEIQALRREQLSSAQALARAIPAYTLHVSLSGAFWTEIEGVLLETQAQLAQAAEPAPPPSRAGNDKGQDVESWLDDGLLHFAYRGPSMNPTLREPDLVDVRPYQGRPIHRGDAIYYRSPQGGEMVVHRVVEVSPGGVRTQGDNNARQDPYLLPLQNIKGQVIAAQRGAQRRPIAGGWRGVGAAYKCRVRPWVRRPIALALRGACRAAARTGIVVRLLPARLRPRVVIYAGQPHATYKLLLDSREIGRYNYRESHWEIRWLWRILVDEEALPHPQ